ncbi:hypothetical protein D0U02_00470 [Burkholderia pseudomallei]|uniref:Uncharacterized protein n=2 Tax=Pseudomonadota TaxID=1224 RepID=Q63XI3_BURPS|nr:hypothetical protein AQ727_26015 [Burkholderia pseudomallei]CAH34546.1 hypothetical protein BPSL0557 [Burkholderia pseudomallei K96243]OMS18916.1 hypothetical protein AQ736_01400 [Burkholderia pseudomallei]OMS35791.1 hypothetical protein AQ739_29335 [Burkholderia pseudomallei]OMT00011.1 hypothetical protein AQ752_29735 [Burkholderia pseudomallei]
MTLLEHFSGPAVENEVDQAGLIKLCESGFEREFFGMLVERGLSRHPAGEERRYRLDLVVEGANDARLASSAMATPSTAPTGGPVTCPVSEFLSAQAGPSGDASRRRGVCARRKSLRN